MAMQRIFLTIILLLNCLAAYSVKGQNNVPVMSYANGTLRSPTNFFFTNVIAGVGITLSFGNTNGQLTISANGTSYNYNINQFTLINGTNVSISSGALLTNLNTTSITNSIYFTNGGPSDLGGAVTNWSTVRNKANVTNDAILHQSGNLVLNALGASRLVATDANKNISNPAASSGQIPIGTAAGAYTMATITPGGGIVIGNGSGSITLSWDNTNKTIWPTAGSFSAVPLTINAPNSPSFTGNLQEWKNNSVLYSWIGSAGQVGASSVNSSGVGNFGDVLWATNRIVVNSSSITTVPLTVNMGSTNGAEFKDGSGNLVAMVTTNGYFRNTNQFYTTLTTSDNTTNNIYTFTPRDNQAIRVIANVVGYNSTSSASYGKVATFKSVAGVVTQVAATATVGQAEDDATYECLVDTSANVIRIRVAGNTGRTVNWTVWGETFYSPGAL